MKFPTLLDNFAKNATLKTMNWYIITFFFLICQRKPENWKGDKKKLNQINQDILKFDFKLTQ